jgi:hypothetical protein
MKAARERNLVHPAQIALPRGVAEYPRRYETTATFGDVKLAFRPVRPTDEAMLK